jgi:hypothetical protein
MILVDPYRAAYEDGYRDGQRTAAIRIRQIRWDGARPEDRSTWSSPFPSFVKLIERCAIAAEDSEDAQ